MNGMRVGIGMSPSALEVFPTHQAAVYVDVRERYRADLLEIEVEDCSVDLCRPESFNILCA